jgi:hypothetical protein
MYRFMRLVLPELGFPITIKSILTLFFDDGLFYFYIVKSKNYNSLQMFEFPKKSANSSLGIMMMGFKKMTK